MNCIYIFALKLLQTNTNKMRAIKKIMCNRILAQKESENFYLVVFFTDNTIKYKCNMNSIELCELIESSKVNVEIQ